MVPLPPLRDGARALPISSFRQSMPSFDTRCPGLHLQPGASVVLGCVGELPGSRCTDFNPRAPCGARQVPCVADANRTLFQSTRPVWGATTWRTRRRTCSTYFNPRAPCGARLYIHRSGRRKAGISIHAPRVGRDPGGRHVQQPDQISIHAPRVGRDGICGFAESSVHNFNPRAPCGARPEERQIIHTSASFQSTRPVWGATIFVKLSIHFSKISIHAPRVGRDAALAKNNPHAWNFNPRAPCGARLCVLHDLPAADVISIHAPRVGRDTVDAAPIVWCKISIHAPRVGRDFVLMRAAM